MKFPKAWSGVVYYNPIFSETVSFLCKHPENWLPRAVELHVTVKAPNGLDGNLKWLNAVRNECKSWRAFDMTIGTPDSFGNSVLFLTAE